MAFHLRAERPEVSLEELLEELQEELQELLLAQQLDAQRLMVKACNMKMDIHIFLQRLTLLSLLTIQHLHTNLVTL
jgi:hypothetical protein